MRDSKFRHDPRRDTMWVGKGGGPVWLLLVLVLLVGAAAPLIFR